MEIILYAYNEKTIDGTAIPVYTLFNHATSEFHTIETYEIVDDNISVEGCFVDDLLSFGDWIGEVEFYDEPDEYDMKWMKEVIHLYESRITSTEGE